MKRLLTQIISALFCVQLVMSGFLPVNVFADAVEPLVNFVEFGNMETETTSGWAKASSASDSTTITIVEDSEKPGNHVLRFDGTGNNQNSNSYMAYNYVLETGKEYYYSYKIRLASDYEYTGSHYAYMGLTGGLRDYNTHRPALSHEWVIRTGIITGAGAKMSFKVISTQGTSSSNVPQAIYELDDIVIYDASFGEVFTVDENSDLNGATIDWKSGVIAVQGGSGYKSYGSLVTFALNPVVYTYVTTVTVNGEIIIPDSDGVYSVTLPEDGTFLINVQVEADNIPKVLSVVPENVMNADTESMEIDVTFDREMNIDSLKSDIQVTPSADFDVTENGEYTYKITFSGMEEATEYTVLFDGLLSDMGYAMDTPYTYVFSTFASCKNIIENGDMSVKDTSKYFDNDKNGISYTMDGDNSVLRWEVTYEKAPLIQYLNDENRSEKYKLIAGHTYYISARLKADKETKLDWSITYTNNKGESNKRLSVIEKTVESGKWIVLNGTFIAPDDIDTEKKHGIRLGAEISQNTVYVDDVELIDCSVNPTSKPMFEGSYPVNNATEIKVGKGEMEAEISFDMPILPTKADTTNITAEGATLDEVSLSDDKKTLIISLSKLKANKTVTINYENLTSMAGEAVDNGSVTFLTETMSAAAPQIVKASPANGKSVGLADLSVLEIEYDLSLDGPIEKESFTTVPENLIDSVEWSYENRKFIKINLNKAALSAGNTYSVTVLPSVESLAATPVNEETITFNVIGKEEIVQAFKNNLSVNQDVYDFITYCYGDLTENDTLCKNILEKDSEIAEDFAEIILEKGISSDADAEDIVKMVQVEAALLVVNDSKKESLIGDAVCSSLTDNNMTSLLNTFSNLKDDVKTKFCGEIKAKTTDFTEETLKDYLKKEIILTAVQNSKGSVALSKVLNDNIQYLQNDTKELIGKINGAVNKEEIYLSLQGKAFSSEKEIYDTLNDAYKAPVNKDPEKKPSPGVGGAGGGGGRDTFVSGNETEDETKAPAKDEDKPALKSSFKDIDSVPWAKEAIEHFYELKVISGKTLNEFCPNDFVTREEFVKMIVLAANVSITENNNNFSDVQAGEWYSPYISAATSANLVQGVDSLNFGIGRNISRQDIATICHRLLAETEDEEESEDSEIAISDYDAVSEYAKDAVKKLVSLGIIKGDENGNFAPHKNATRAETAVLLQRLIAYKNTEER